MFNVTLLSLTAIYLNSMSPFYSNVQTNQPISQFQLRSSIISFSFQHFIDSSSFNQKFIFSDNIFRHFLNTVMYFQSNNTDISGKIYNQLNGTALSINNSDLIITNCSFYDCKADTYPGGIYFNCWRKDVNNLIIMTECIFERCINCNGGEHHDYETCNPGGGAAYLNTINATITRCCCDQCGGGVELAGASFAVYSNYQFLLSELTITNCKGINLTGFSDGSLLVQAKESSCDNISRAEHINISYAQAQHCSGLLVKFTPNAIFSDIILFSNTGLCPIRSKLNNDINQMNLTFEFCSVISNQLESAKKDELPMLIHVYIDSTKDGSYHYITIDNCVFYNNSKGSFNFVSMNDTNNVEFNVSLINSQIDMSYLNVSGNVTISSTNVTSFDEDYSFEFNKEQICILVSRSAVSDTITSNPGDSFNEPVLSLGAIIGFVIGGLALIAIVVSLIIYFKLRNKKEKKYENSTDEGEEQITAMVTNVTNNPGETAQDPFAKDMNEAVDSALVL